MNSENQIPAGSSASSPKLPKAPLSPRRRRLRWTIAILSASIVVGIGLGAKVYFKTRSRPYRPDEQNAEITSSLARSLPADAPKVRFADVTREAGLSSFRTFVGDRTSQLPEDMGPGAAWGDFNNDGFDDLFLVSAGGPLNVPPEKLAPCELYENLGNGTFRKVDGFPETRIHGMAAAWGDYDGDGFLDLVVTGYNTLLLFHNEHGTGKFMRDSRFPDLKGFWSGATWGDYDNDRNLDLYVCGYVQYVQNDTNRARISQQLGSFVPYTLNPASYQGGTNLLFHNNGDGTFTEVAGKLGVTNPEGRSLGALWHDFDDDGWLDLYIANDISDNVLYHNVGGKFEDISHPAYVADYRSAMGLAAGDYNRDGDDDLFITHWVGQENALYDNVFADFNANPAANPSPPTTPSLQHSNLNQYPLRFMDIADLKGLGQIAIPFVGWGTEFADFDDDGWLDLIVANGNTLEFDGPPPKKLKPQEPFLFWNRRGEYFYNLAPSSKPLSEQHVSRGLAVADYDHDGALDFVVMQLGEGAQLFRNEMQTGNWFKVRLRNLTKGGAPLGFGDGAKVIAHLGGVGLRRTVSSVSYLSQSSRTLHFGLGKAASVDQLEVRWHAGATNYFTNLDANATWEITEGELAAKRLPVRSPGFSRPGVAEMPGADGLSNAPPAKARTPNTDKAKLVEFWNKQRAAMNALKVDKNIPKAITLFHAALEFDPQHEDSHYYLGQCLALQGDWDGALAQLAELTRINPQSHRGHQQWGTLRAISGKTGADLIAAEKSLETAHALNPEETGALLVLGEIALLRGDREKAEQRLTAACRTNPRAVGGFFLRGYLALGRGDRAGAEDLLKKTREALGKDWQPKGATSEGDVKQKQHVESTPLARFWDRWNGAPDPDKSFAALDEFLKSRR